MSGVFTASEVVEIGIRIEENGRDFYNVLTDKSKDEKARSIFKFLSGEEEKHIVAFRNILEKVEKYEATDSYPGEYFSYLTALAGEYVFAQKDTGSKIAQGTKDDKEAITLGIGFEKDSIIFYEGIKKVVSSNQHKIIDELVLQERNHLKALSELEKELVQ